NLMLSRAGNPPDPEAARRRAEQGCAGAQADACFQDALRWGSVAPRRLLLETACAHDQLDACNSLGVIYDNGEQVEEDPAKALGYFRDACDAGNALACRNLAVMKLVARGGA